jgi:predicted site-specific integrase-resolvase
MATPVLDKLWTAKDVAALLGVPVATLYQWRYTGTGPKACRVDKHLRYHPDEVWRWFREEACNGQRPEAA